MKENAPANAEAKRAALSNGVLCLSYHHHLFDTTDKHNQHYLRTALRLTPLLQPTTPRLHTPYNTPLPPRPLGPSPDRLQAQLHRPIYTHATVAVLRNGAVIGESNQ